MEKINLNCFLKIPSSWIAEIVGRTGFDYVTIDMQHGLIDYQSALSMMQSMPQSKILVRVSWNEPAQIMKMLDAGAIGIICPMVNTKEEAEKFVKSCLYAPMGIRSMGPTRAKLIHQFSDAKHTNNEVLTFAMIETMEAFENLEHIAQTENLKGLYVGPTDLSLSFGFDKLADFNNDRFIDLLKKIVEIGKKNNLIVASQVYGPEQAKIAIGLGFDLVTPVDDNAVFQSAIHEQFNLLKRVAE